MKARYSYPLLFLLPSAMVAFLTAFVVVGVGAGALWVFVYGDNTWPKSADAALMSVAVFAAAATLSLLLFASYSYGRSREPTGGLARRHVVWALVISILLPAVVFLRQWQIGNPGTIGPKADTLVCANFCTTNKFNASRPPQDGTCRCYGKNGQESLNISMNRVHSDE
jgi:hypothetical protein